MRRIYEEKARYANRKSYSKHVPGVSVRAAPASLHVRERLKRNAQLAEYQQIVTLGLVERGRQRFASLYLGAAVSKG